MDAPVRRDSSAVHCGDIRPQQYNNIPLSLRVRHHRIQLVVRRDTLHLPITHTGQACSPQVHPIPFPPAHGFDSRLPSTNSSLIY